MIGRSNGACMTEMASGTVFGGILEHPALLHRQTHSCNCSEWKLVASGISALHFGMSTIQLGALHSKVISRRAGIAGRDSKTHPQPHFPPPRPPVGQSEPALSSQTHVQCCPSAPRSQCSGCGWGKGQGPQATSLPSSAEDRSPSPHMNSRRLKKACGGPCLHGLPHQGRGGREGVG